MKQKTHKLALAGLLAFCLFVGTCTSPISNKPDTTPPSPITSIFFYQALPTEVELGWVAPADDKSDSVKLYDCRFSTDSLTPASWKDAGIVPNLPVPGHSGSYERVLFSGLDSLTTYYFAIRSMDKAGNYSALSPVIKKIALPLDTLPPSPISDLRIVRSDTFSLQLTWTTPNERNDHAAARYEIRYDTSTITEQNWLHAHVAPSPPIPSVPGSPESFLLTGLLSNTSYYCAIRSADLLGNTSSLSNMVSGKTFDTTFTDTIPTDTNSVDTLVVNQITKFGGPIFVFPQAFVQTLQGDIIVAGSTGLHPSDNYLAKLDDSGNVIWENSFGSGADESLTDVAITSDQLIVTIGYIGYERGRVAVRWFSQAGQILKTMILDSSNATGAPYYVPKVVATPDGGIAILYESSQQLDYGNGITSVPRIAKYNILGEEEWNQYQLAGSSCQNQNGEHSDPSATIGKLDITDTLIIFSWVAEWQDQSSLWCGPFLDGSYVSVFGIGGGLAHATAIQEIYDGTPLNSAFIMVNQGTTSSNGFTALESEPYIYSIAQFDGQGYKIASHNNVLTTSPAINGAADISSKQYLTYGSVYTGKMHSSLYAGIVDELGNIRTQFLLPDSEQTTANDAIVSADGKIIIIGTETARNSIFAQGLFIRLRLTDRH